MPASFARKPFGVVRFSEVISCSPSLRVSFRTKGLVAPAAAETVPAERPGLNGRAPGEEAQGEPFGPEPTAKLELGVASGGPGVDHGTRSEVVWNEPQVVGVARGARGPDFRSSCRCLTGSCGFSVKVAVSWPVSLFATAVPGSLKLIP